MIPPAVSAAWGVAPEELQPVATVYRPAAAYRAGGLLIKPFRHGERQLHCTVAALRHLEQRRFRRTPRLVPTRNGKAYVTCAGRLWYATTWITGRPPRWPEDLSGAAVALAAFHQASEGCPLPYPVARCWHRRWSSLLSDLLAFGAIARARSGPFDRAYAAAAGPFLAVARAAWAALEESAYDPLAAAYLQRRTFCHRDVTAANLVVDPAGQVCLVDPDTWGPDLRVGDLARLLLAGTGAGPGQAVAAVAAYAAAYPLDPRERALLPWAYALPREFWWAGVCHYRRPAAGVDPGALLKAAVMDFPARQACARALRENPS